MCYYYHAEWDIIGEQIMPSLSHSHVILKFTAPAYPWENLPDNEHLYVVTINKKDKSLILLD